MRVQAWKAKVVSVKILTLSMGVCDTGAVDELFVGVLPPAPVTPLPQVVEIESLGPPCLLPTRLESAFPKATSLSRATSDARSITQLLGQMARRSGLSTSDLARQMDILPGTLRSYFCGVRTPGWKWFLRFAEACGAEVFVNFPSKR